jgi:hypothetical protein
VPIGGIAVGHRTDGAPARKAPVSRNVDVDSSADAEAERTPTPTPTPTRARNGRVVRPRRWGPHH